MTENNSHNYHNKAEFLLFTAKTYAITLITALEEASPQFMEIRYSNLFELWDYYITMTYIGVAYMLIADSFQEQEIDPMDNAVKKVIGDWVTPHKYDNHYVLKNFLDNIDSFVKAGYSYDVAIGSWVFIQLKGSKKATSQLIKLAENENSAKLIGAHIIAVVLKHWKNN